MPPSSPNKQRISASLFIVLGQTFLSECSRGIVMAGLWPYLHQLISSHQDARRQLALAVSLFSVGRLVSSIPYGYMVDWTNSTRNTLLVSTSITIFGSIMYMAGAYVGDGLAAVQLILASRFISGFGSGTLSATRAFVVKISRPEERTDYIGWNTLMQFVGMSLSPILPMLIRKMAPAGSPNWRLDDVYIPGLVIIVLNTVMILLLVFVMPRVDKYHPSGDQHVETTTTTMTTPDESRWERARRLLGHVASPWAWSRLDVAFALFFFLNVSLRGVVGIAETIAAEEHQRVNSDDADAVDDSSEFLLMLGLVGTATFLSLRYMSAYFSSDSLLIFGMGAIVSGSILLLPPVMNDRMPFLIFGTGLIWSVGSPITQVLTISTYSQLMGSRPQGGVMGWLTTAGSVGRIVFPLLTMVNLTAAHSVSIATVGLSAIVTWAFSRYGRPKPSSTSKLTEGSLI